MRLSMPRFGALLGMAILAAGPLSDAGAAVTGVVFHDYNANGQRDAGSVSEAVDRGIGGVTVSAFGPSGACGTPTTTSSSSGSLGQYTLDTTGCPASPALLRIEFSGLPSGYVTAPQSLASRGATLAATRAASSVQFVTDGASNVETALHIPAEYCQNNPNYALPIQVFGNASAPANTNLSTLARLAYAAAGSDATPTGGITPDSVARSIETGTLYGLAYDRLTDRLFASAYMKRHAGLGPSGTGAIYAINGASGGTPSTTLYVDLNGVFGAGTAGSDTIRGDFEGSSVSGDQTWDEVGKVALGDIELSESGATLYAVNLADRQLYRIPTSGALNNTTILRTPIPTAACANAADARPFALAVRGATVYVGGVCSAEVSDDPTNLSAWVYSFDGTSFSASPVIQFSLNYPRANADAGSDSSITGNAVWRSWTDLEAAPQDDQQWPEPILADIAFDHGDMLLGFRDRHGDQTGTGTNTIRGITGGELLRACANGSGGWNLESNGTCGSVTGAVGATGSAPAGNQARGPGSLPAGGEYYGLDVFNNGGTAIDGVRFDGLHDETSQGALMQIPGFDLVAVTAMDPFRTNSGGMRWYSNSDPANASLARGLQVFITPTNGSRFSKANGLGDLQALCLPAGIEVGNYVWADANRDGIMDPDESPIANVLIQAYDNSGSLLGAATTDAQGEYYFTFNQGSDANNSDNTILQPSFPFSGNYFLVIANSNFNSGGPLFNRTITSGFSSSSTLRDSNGIVGAVPVVGTVTHATLALTGPGGNDHSVDFGFGITQYDFGDLPDGASGIGIGNYETLDANGGARHVINTNLKLGNSIDAESDGQPSVAAGDDDTNGGLDDEDGVTSPLTFVRGNPAQVTLTATNTMADSATLCGYIDFNADGDFDDASESASAGVSIGLSNATVTLNFGTVPTADSAASSYARFRIMDKDSTCSVNGTFNEGEVEDYAVTIAAAGPTLDFGDLPDSTAGIGPGNYETFQENDGPRHIVVTNLYLGARVDAEIQGQPGTTANNDDANGGLDDEDGVTSPLTFVRGNPATVTLSVTNNVGSAATLCGFIDFNGNGSFADANETTSATVTNSGSVNLNFGNVPAGTVTDSYARFRISTDGGPCLAVGGGAPASNGEVEDYAVTIAAAGPTLDFGDLPDSTTVGGIGPGNYETLQANDGPRHIVVPNLYLGARVDAEGDGQPSVAANDDDTNGGLDDEDGVTSPLTFVRGNPATVTLSVTNNVGSAATLCGFIDFNGNGSFADANETTSATVANGTTSGSVSLNFGTVPAGTVTASYARFRISTDGSPCSSLGSRSNGEVEDYAVTISAGSPGPTPSAPVPVPVPVNPVWALLLLGLLLSFSAWFSLRRAF